MARFKFTFFEKCWPLHGQNVKNYQMINRCNLIFDQKKKASIIPLKIKAKLICLTDTVHVDYKLNLLLMNNHTADWLIQISMCTRSYRKSRYLACCKEAKWQWKMFSNCQTVWGKQYFFLDGDKTAIKMMHLHVWFCLPENANFEAYFAPRIRKFMGSCQRLINGIQS